MHQMAVQTPAIVETLGGRAVVGNVRTELELHEQIDQGLKYGVLLALGARLKASTKEIGEMLRIPQSTLRRREGKRLDANESERAARLARITVLGKEAFGSYAALKGWLLKPNRGFENKRPIELLQTEVGAREIEAGLGRLLYGGYG